jgi:hypothetical protein
VTVTFQAPRRTHQDGANRAVIEIRNRLNRSPHSQTSAKLASKPHSPGKPTNFSGKGPRGLFQAQALFTVA